MLASSCFLRFWSHTSPGSPSRVSPESFEFPAPWGFAGSTAPRRHGNHVWNVNMGTPKLKTFGICKFLKVNCLCKVVSLTALSFTQLPLGKEARVNRMSHLSKSRTCDWSCPFKVPSRPSSLQELFAKHWSSYERIQLSRIESVRLIEVVNIQTKCC